MNVQIRVNVMGNHPLLDRLQPEDKQQYAEALRQLVRAHLLGYVRNVTAGKMMVVSVEADVYEQK